MNVAVDQARAHDLAPGVDHDFGIFVTGPERQDPAAADPQVADLVDILRGVDDPSAADLNGSHGFSPSSTSGSGAPAPRWWLLRAVGRLANPV